MNNNMNSKELLEPPARPSASLSEMAETAQRGLITADNTMTPTSSPESHPAIGISHPTQSTVQNLAGRSRRAVAADYFDIAPDKDGEVVVILPRHLVLHRGFKRADANVVAKAALEICRKRWPDAYVKIDNGRNYATVKEACGDFILVEYRSQIDHDDFDMKLWCEAGAYVKESVQNEIAEAAIVASRPMILSRPKTPAEQKKDAGQSSRRPRAKIDQIITHYYGAKICRLIRWGTVVDLIWGKAVMVNRRGVKVAVPVLNSKRWTFGSIREATVYYLICNNMYHNGVPSTPPRKWISKLGKLADLVEAGKTATEISDTIGIPITHVERVKQWYDMVEAK